MSAVYRPSDFDQLYNKNFTAVIEYVKIHPGTSVEACATANSVPYEVVYAICMAAGMKILPNASGELQFGPTGHGPGRP